MTSITLPSDTTICYHCRECLNKFGDSIGLQLWEAINDCFDVMPVAATVDDRVSIKQDKYWPTTMGGHQ